MFTTQLGIIFLGSSLAVTLSFCIRYPSCLHRPICCSRRQKRLYRQNLYTQFLSYGAQEPTKKSGGCWMINGLQRQWGQTGSPLSPSIGNGWFPEYPSGWIPEYAIVPTVCTLLFIQVSFPDVYLGVAETCLIPDPSLTREKSNPRGLSKYLRTPEIQTCGGTSS